MNTTINFESWIQLALMPAMHGHKLDQLLEHYHDLEQLLNLPTTQWRRLGYSDKACAYLIPKPKLIKQTLRWLEDPQHYLITWHDPRYPELLKQISDPPILLYIVGQPEILNQPQLAMVGSRNPTPLGLDLAYDYAEQLGNLGLIVTSGLALGIDAASHKGALATKMPTIAVLANGLDAVYPKRHRKLAEQIIVQGALVSEFPLGTQPQREFFPQRNRIISGMSLGTLVVEATPNSGSLITARFALEQNRDVFAIPGSIHNPMATGCNQLIQQGAKLVTGLADIVEEIPIETASCSLPTSRPVHHRGKKALESHHSMLLECVGFEATPVDKIIAQSQLNTSLVLRELLFLEINGYIAKVPGGYIKRL